MSDASTLVWIGLVAGYCLIGAFAGGVTYATQPKDESEETKQGTTVMCACLWPIAIMIYLGFCAVDLGRKVGELWNSPETWSQMVDSDKPEPNELLWSKKAFQAECKLLQAEAATLRHQLRHQQQTLEAEAHALRLQVKCLQEELTAARSARLQPARGL